MQCILLFCMWVLLIMLGMFTFYLPGIKFIRQFRNSLGLFVIYLIYLYSFDSFVIRLSKFCFILPILVSFELFVIHSAVLSCCGLLSCVNIEHALHDKTRPIGNLRYFTPVFEYFTTEIPEVEPIENAAYASLI